MLKHETNMKNLHVKRIVKIEACFTAGQWQLYSDDQIIAACVAGELNREIERCVNLGYAKEDTSRFVRSVMRQRAEFGADDTEPHRFLEQVLDEIYANPLEF